MTEQNPTPADPAATPAQAPATATPAPSPTPADSPAQAEPDWKAEARKWEARAKENKTAADRLAEIEESNKTEAQKQAERMAELEKSATTAKVEALRYKYAAKHKISDEDAELFLTATDEETIAKQAKRLAARESSQQQQPQPGAHVPGEGRTPANPNLDQQIEEATKARDFNRAIALKQQRAAQQQRA